MNRFRKIFLLITFVVFFVGIISPFFVFAAEPPKTVVNFCPQIDIPFIDMFDTKKYPCKEKKDPITGARSDAFHINTSSIADLAAGAYKFIAGIAGIAAVIVMMAGGYVWLFAGGNASKVGEAKSLIGSAVLGLFLVLGSFMILNLINPRLVELKSLDKIAGITQIKVGTASKICTKPERDAFAKEKKIDMVDQSTCGQVYKREGAEDCINISCPYKIDSICLLMVDSKGEYSGKGCVNSISAAYGETMSDASVDDIANTFTVKGFSMRNDSVNYEDCGIVTITNKDASGVVGGFCGPTTEYKDNTCHLITSGDRIEDGPAAFPDGGVIKMHNHSGNSYQSMGCEK